MTTERTLADICPEAVQLANELSSSMNDPWIDKIEAICARLVELAAESDHWQAQCADADLRWQETGKECDAALARVKELEGELAALGGIIGVPTGMEDAPLAIRARHVHREYNRNMHKAEQRVLALEAEVERLRKLMAEAIGGVCADWQWDQDCPVCLDAYDACCDLLPGREGKSDG